jgi:hypothetical protein
LIGLLTVNIKHQYGLLACAWLQAVLGSPIILGWTLLGVNVAGHTKRSTVLALYFV